MKEKELEKYSNYAHIRAKNEINSIAHSTDLSNMDFAPLKNDAYLTKRDRHHFL